MTKAKDDAIQIVYEILTDMTGRTGFRALWEAIEGEVQISIVEKWVQITTDVLAAEQCGVTYIVQPKYPCTLEVDHIGWHEAWTDNGIIKWYSGRL